MNKGERNALIQFVDEFTTVSTNENLVGADVSKIVLDVNKHSHTKACRKYDSSCRFNCPRYPSTRTIISVPLVEANEKKKAEKLKTYKEILKKGWRNPEG